MMTRYLKRAEKILTWFKDAGNKDKVFGHEIINALKISDVKEEPSYCTTNMSWTSLKPFSNPSDKLHGGAIATLIEYSGAIATIVNEPYGMAPVCINSVVDYNSPCDVNQEILVEAMVKGLGKGHAFTD